MDDRSFIRKYIFSTDHKIIGIQFLIMSLIFLLLGGTLAMLMRWQLGFPGKPHAGRHAAPRNHGLRRRDAPRVLQLAGHDARHVHDVLRHHAAAGRRVRELPDSAQDRRARHGVPAHQHGVVLDGGAGRLAHARRLLRRRRQRRRGLDVVRAAQRRSGSHRRATSARRSGASASSCSALSSIMGSINYITTVINMRAPGNDAGSGMPLAIWALFITAILLLLAMPVLSGAAIMLLFDQTIGTHFFLTPAARRPAAALAASVLVLRPSRGLHHDPAGDGHGLGHHRQRFARKPIFGYTSMVLAIIGIAFLGWIVWGHHMFQSGMNPTLGTTFMISTMLIAVPSAIKTFNWLGTMWRGNITFHDADAACARPSCRCSSSAACRGIFMAATPVDIYIHDTYFIVAHLHYVLFGGSLFAHLRRHHVLVSRRCSAG